ncbi:hypothetical protein Trydic_g15878, partial [Trypoxylus dichotomus]
YLTLFSRCRSETQCVDPVESSENARNRVIYSGADESADGEDNTTYIYEVDAPVRSNKLNVSIYAIIGSTGAVNCK